MVAIFAVTNCNVTVASILHKHITFCTLVVIQETNHGSQSTPIELKLNLQDQRTGIFLFTQKFSPPLQFLDLHKQRNRCTIAHIEINSKTNKQLENFSSNLKTLILTLSGVIKKDEDYFLYSAPSRHVIKKMMLLSASVKYKLGIILNTPTNSLSSYNQTYFGACLFCNKGSQSIYELTINPNETKILSIFPDSANNFFNKTLRISTPFATWITEIRYNAATQQWYPVRGIYNTVIKHLMATYNFSGIFFPSAGGGGTGIQLDNGTWIGVVGDVLYKNGDIGQAAGQNFHRNKVVSYSIPISYEWLTFVTSKPQPYYTWRAVFWSFDSSGWVLIIGLTLSAFFITFAIVKIEGTSWSPSRTVAFMLATMVDQNIIMGYLNGGKSLALRIFASFFFLFSIIVASAYKSKLVSLLAFPVFSSVPTGFKELSESRFDTGLYFMKGAAYNLLKTSPNPIYKKIFNNMELITNDVNCIQKATNEKFACIMWANIAEFVGHRNLSDRFGRVNTLIASEKTTPMPGGILMEKMTVFRTNFDRAILAWTDFGLLSRWKKDDVVFIRNERRELRKLERNLPNPEQYLEDEETDTLSLQHLTGSFLILTSAHTIAIILFSAEQFYGRWWNRNEGHLPIGVNFE